MIELNRTCTRYRPLLIDFVDRGEVRAETSSALAHLDRCERCTEVVESTMLTITALRRMGDEADEAAAAEPAPDAWPRLRGRILGWRRRPVTMSPLAGVAMSFAIVAVLVLPVGVGGSLIGPVATPVSEAPSSAAADRQIEAAYLASLRQRPLPGDGGPATGGWLGADPRPYPEFERPEGKEVSPAEPTGKAPRAI